METKEIKAEKEVKPLKNKENSEASGSEENNQSKVKKKESHKNENKAWLSQRISELGEDKILYSSNSSGRHPYTREVLLLAELRGLKQVNMAEMCQVSQPQISQWLSGQSKATGEQLKPVINEITPVLPGKDFHFKTIINRVFIALSEGWEYEAVSKYLSSDREYSGLRGVSTSKLTREDISKLVLAGVEKERDEDLKGYLAAYESSMLEKQEAVEELEALKEAYDAELSESLMRIEDWAGVKDKYLLERPMLNNLPENEIESLLNQEFPEPVPNLQSEDALAVFQENICDKYGIKRLTNLNEQCDSITDFINEKISKEELAYESLIQEKKIYWEGQKNKKEIFGKYSQEVDISNIELNKDRRVNDRDIVLSLSEQLYGDTVYLLGNRYSLCMKDIFVDYCLELEPSVEYEDVQICGNKLSRGKFLDGAAQLAYMIEVSLNKATKEINGSGFECGEFETYGVECYQLFSQKLVLICSYEHGHVNYSNIYVFDSAEDFIHKSNILLKRIRKEVDNGDYWPSERQAVSLKDEDIEVVSSYFKQSLISNGYRLSDVRSVY